MKKAETSYLEGQGAMEEIVSRFSIFAEPQITGYRFSEDPFLEDIDLPIDLPVKMAFNSKTTEEIKNIVYGHISQIKKNFQVGLLSTEYLYLKK